ncbi:C1 family peptidase [Aquimarina sediminis]|uniref:C1 family peptidase n=1 Tax=Aquimarina sediminis TaxID=2070536 RepID=UPI000CA00674|nr:C1 family peptidase [Aquimarina sediminis]
MKKIVFIASLFLSVSYAQEIHPDYTITDTVSHQCTPVISQENTGTCWSFSTTSYIESEIARLGKGTYDLSELYQVRNTYTDKARNYILRQGKAQFSEGALSHDVINSIRNHGIVPDTVYTGLSDNPTNRHDHSELIKLLTSMVDNAVKHKILSKNWWKSYEAMLDIYLGERPSTFNYENKEYTPVEFAKKLGIEADNYITFTSFTHHPMYSSFILEIPDNFSNGIYHNVKLDELQQIVDYALKEGFTIAWDGDVSEIGFSQKNGLAILTNKEESKNIFNQYSEEEKVTQESRQKEFENYNTTDDHLMHLVGKGVDKKGKTYYKIKNSWGTDGAQQGYLYMSDAYFRMKTVGILLHKDGVPKNIKEKV